jgi:hypothetical protein
MSIRRWLCNLIGCSYDEKNPAKSPPPIPERLEQKERAYRDASHEMRNVVAKLQGEAKQRSAFDQLARRWE